MTPMDVDGGACESGQVRDGLLLTAYKFYSPKENPKRPLGQDAFFYSESKQTIGVFDGVGGVTWADSGEYARELSENGHKFIKDHPTETVHPIDILHAAYIFNRAKGASTACIITLYDNSLHAANLGDSGFMVIREGKTVYKSPVQQNGFNCPFQLSSAGDAYNPTHADKIVVPVERGDVVVAATDGLFDNLFDSEIEQIVMEEHGWCARAALHLGCYARGKSQLKDCVTPFTMEAAKHGIKRSGGKYDDVTVVVGNIY